MKPLARIEHIVVEDLGVEYVVYDSRSKMAHSLNSTASWVWQHCDGNTTIEEMADLLQGQSENADALDAVRQAVQQLRNADLLVEPTAAWASTEGGPQLTRRSVMAAGALAAPVVGSILAPTAASAKSNDDFEKDKDKDKDKDKAKDKDK
jgi:hypothetical protein